MESNIKYLVYTRPNVSIKDEYIVHLRYSMQEPQAHKILKLVLDKEDDLALTFLDLEKWLSSEGLDLEIVYTVYRTALNREFPVNDAAAFQPFHALAKPVFKIICNIPDIVLSRFELCVSPFFRGPDIFRQLSEIIQQSTTEFYVTLFERETNKGNFNQYSKSSMMYSEEEELNAKKAMQSSEEKICQNSKKSKLAHDKDQFPSFKEAVKMMKDSQSDFYTDYEKIIISRTNKANIENPKILDTTKSYLLVSAINYGPICIKVDKAGGRGLKKGSMGYEDLYISEKTTVRELKEMLEMILNEDTTTTTMRKLYSAHLRIVINLESRSDEVNVVGLFKKNEPLIAVYFYSSKAICETQNIKYGLPDMTKTLNMIETRAVHANMLRGMFSLAPEEWRFVSRGLNVEGVCKNLKCKSGGNVSVVSREGYGMFDISTRKYDCLCPVCHTAFEFENFIFVDCAYIFKGVYYDEKEMIKVESDTPVVVNIPDGYLTFRNQCSLKDSVIKWGTLTIVTVDLDSIDDLTPKNHCRLCCNSDQFDSFSRVCNVHQMHNYCFLYFGLKDCIFCDVEKTMKTSL